MLQQIITCCTELPSFHPPFFPFSSFVKFPSFLPVKEVSTKLLRVMMDRFLYLVLRDKHIVMFIHRYTFAPVMPYACSIDLDILAICLPNFVLE